MRAAPIPDAEVPEGARRIVMAGPDGDLTSTDIGPAEMLLVVGANGPEYSARMVLDDEERAALAAGAPLWLTFVGLVPPFAAGVGGL